ncbi:PQQ-binding-like beta-propeller repeat protein [Candidatus Amarolinea aalborgensis]|uniref:outer membrane protein assembly factor BamB family protein n=1 Tax=Candidatus Amarolinea aalborgensis TaxID=2249329 RepID=UPI003BF985A3
MTSWMALPSRLSRRLRGRSTSRRLYNLLSYLLLITLLIGLLPPPGVDASAAENSAAGAPQAAPVPESSSPPVDHAASTLTGALRFSPAVDTDRDPSTNPLPTTPLAVLRVGGDGQEVRYTQLDLAVEVIPDAAQQNPAGTPVTFHLWNASRQVDLERRTTADAWGAAGVHFVLDDLHLGGPFFYSASAPGLGPTEVRTFDVDAQRIGHDTQLGAASLTTHFEPDGRLVVDVTSTVAIDEGLDAVQLTALHLIPAGAAEPDKELLPPLVARRLDAYHARAEIYLDAGYYLLNATVLSGHVEASSQPVFVEVTKQVAPPVAQVEQIGNVSDDLTTALVQYRTPDGYAALLTRRLADLPTEAATPPPSAPVFVQSERSGPFSWRTVTYTSTVQVQADDHKKRVVVDGFAYDPLARRYDIRIESLMPKTVEDKLTVQVLGPHGVVIYEETAPILLDPAAPLTYQVSVPSDRGEPSGLRIIVHDPADISWLFQKVGDLVQTVYDYLRRPINDAGFSITASFRFQLKVIEIDVGSYAVVCSELCETKPSGLFFKPGDWVATITTGVRDFLRNQYRDVAQLDDLDKIIAKLGEGIPLGSLTLTTTLGARYTRVLIDPASCPSQQALQAAKDQLKANANALKEIAKFVTFRFKTISETFQSKAKIRFTIPGLWFLGAELAPVFAFKLEADKTPNELGIFGEFNLEVGGKFGLKLKASALLDLVISIANGYQYITFVYRLVETAKTMDTVFKVISEAQKQSVGGGCGGGGSSGSGGTGGGGKKNPPPPNGSPDDRRDASLNDHDPSPAGLSGDLQYYQQQVSIADQAGFTHAAAYYRVSLAATELAIFEADTQKMISHTLEMDAIYQAADVQVRSLISGTVLPPPGQTITDAVQSAYTDFYVQLDNTTFDRERRVLRDALEFARRIYAGLRGQELELQRELRQMTSATGVGILDSGLVFDAIGAIGSLGIKARPVEIVAGTGTSRLAESRYVDPYQAPPVVIVPSGGLYRYQESAQARAWLATYTAIGGTLVVLAQADSPDWGLLPGGEVQGLGYFQDILCKDASVRIINASAWITGLDRDRPNIQVDGSFTQWPTSATVVLMRTTGNQMPAMIEYPYGAGLVVATSAYPDFYMNGLQSDDDIIFARALFGVAALRGGASLLATVAPGQTVSFSTPVTNTTALTMTEVTVWDDYYERRLGESWRWAVHQPNPTRAVQIITLNPPLAPGAAATVAFNFPAPERPGILRIGYFLGGNPSFDPNTWGYSGVIPGPFYQVRSAAVKADLFNFRLTSDQPDYPFGAVATLTATLRNDRPVARTFTLAAVSGLQAAPQTVTVDPHSVITQTYTTVVAKSHLVRLEAQEDGEVVSQAIAPLSLRVPSIGLDATPTSVVAGLDATAIITASVLNGVPGTPVDWEVRRNGVLITSTTTSLVAAVGYLTTVLNVNLPAAAAGAQYTVRAALPGGFPAQTVTIPVRAPATVFDAALTTSPTIGQRTAGAVLVGLDDAGFEGTARLQTILNLYGSPLSAGPVITVPIGGGFQTLDLDLDLPASLDLYAYYTVVVSMTSQITGDFGELSRAAASASTTAYSFPLTVNAPGLTVADAQVNAGQALTARIVPPPTGAQLPAGGPYNIYLHSQDYSFTYFTSVPTATVTADGLEVTLTVPDLPKSGNYGLEVSTPRLNSWYTSATFRAAPYDLVLDAPGNVQAGASLPVSLTNRGGISTTLTGSLSLLDADDIQVVSLAITETLPLSVTRAFTLTVPQGVRSGSYHLAAQGRDRVNSFVSLRQAVAVTGASAALGVVTDADVYAPTDTVTTTSTVTTPTALAGASLRLRVLKPSPRVGGWDGWFSQQGDAGRSGHIAQTATAPFTATWTVSGDPGALPAAVDDLVILLLAADSNTNLPRRLVALDSTSGDARWGPLEIPDANRLVINHRYAVVTRGYEGAIAAYDVHSGALVWSRTLDNPGLLLASDTALVVRTNNGFEVLDPDGGNTLRTIAASANDALLADGRLFVGVNNSLNAYDIGTGDALWSVTLPESPSLVVANSGYVVTYYWTYNPMANQYEQHTVAFAAPTGDETSSTVFPEAQFDPASTVLTDHELFLATRVYSDTGRLDSIEGLNLNTGIRRSLLAYENQEYVMVGAADRLVIYRMNRFGGSSKLMLVALDGTVLSEQDTVAANLPASVESLALSSAGLVGGYTPGETRQAGAAGAQAQRPDSETVFYALQAAAPIGSADTQGDPIVLREEWQAVNGAGVLTYPRVLDAPNLLDDPRARGALLLEGTLFGSQPAAAPPSSRQILARASHAFAVNEIGLTLTADRARYRANLPGYPADDALATVHLTGSVNNSAGVTRTLPVTITRSDGATIYTATLPNIPPGAQASFSANDPTPPAGSVVYTATTEGALSVATVVQINPATLAASGQFVPASIALGETADLQVFLNNAGAVPALATVDIGNGPQAIQLDPGQDTTLTRSVTPTLAGAYTVSVVYSGDVSRTDNIVLQVADQTVSATITPTGVLRNEGSLIGAGQRPSAGPDLVQGDNAGLAFVLDNASPATFDVVADYSLSGPVSRAGSELRTIAPGINSISVPLGAVPVGDYSASLTVRHARLGHVIGSATLSFRVVAPIYHLTVDVQADPMDEQQTQQVYVTARSAYSSEQPWRGALVIEDGDAVVSTTALTLYPGDANTTYLTLDLSQRSGGHTLRGRLVTADDAAAASGQLSINGAPRWAPQAVLTGAAATAGSPGGAVTLSALITNNGPAGDMPLTYLLFDQEYQVLTPVAGYTTAAYDFTVTAPPDLVDGLYAASVRSGDSEQRATVAISGIQMTLAQTLDATSYAPNTPATWTISLHGLSGASALYDVALRYGTQTLTQTVGLGAGDDVVIPWTFDVGPSGDRASVLVQTHALSPEQTRHNLIIDSRWIPVRDDPDVWLESDRARYQSGETVHLTLHLQRPVDGAFVLAPAAIPLSSAPDAPGSVLWTSLALTETVPITRPASTAGVFTMDYALPAMVRSGRYFFTYGYDGEVRSLPVDVFGVDLQTEQLAVQAAGASAAPRRGPAAPLPQGLLPGSPITVTATLRVNRPVPNAAVSAYALAPDGALLDLGAAARQIISLPAGATPVVLHGILNTTQPGAHQIVLEVMDSASGNILGGDAATVDVGAATITGLGADRGVYSPGQPGSGAVSLFGVGATQVLVTTSDSTPLLSQSVVLTGFAQLTFAIPTATVRDEVLLATVTDSQGMTSTRQSAYKVADVFDTTQPEVQITAPLNAATVPMPVGQSLITVSGIVTEETGLDFVLVNGITATVNSSAWSASVPITVGLNFMQAVAVDQAGNVSKPDFVGISVEPNYGISLSVVPTTTVVGGVVAYSALVTTSYPLTAEVAFPFSTYGLNPLSGAASTGAITLTQPVTWTGFVAPDVPVTLTWTAQATQAVTRTAFAVVAGEGMLARSSEQIDIRVDGGICPDFDHSGVIDIADLIAIAGLWGQPAPAGYDLNGDGFVTIVDIQMVAARWGTSC